MRTLFVAFGLGLIGLAASFSLYGFQNAASLETRWEYRHLTLLTHTTSLEDLELEEMTPRQIREAYREANADLAEANREALTELNRLGEEGWEVVAFVPEGEAIQTEIGFTSVSEVLLKRPAR